MSKRNLSVTQVCRSILVVFFVAALTGPAVLAHSPTMDADLSDWCIGAFSNTVPGGGRVEDSSITLTCGNCSVTTDQACEVNSDCPGTETCVNTSSKVETAWWDNRTDGAVNDLGTVAVTQDNENLYIAAELWVDPDPESLPFGLMAIDHSPGGIDRWHDPADNLVAPGNCSVFTDRACTEDEDCHFCQLSKEPFPSDRVRPCGSGCDPDIGDVCETDQTCLNLGSRQQDRVGFRSGPGSLADHLLVFDFSFWFVGAGDSVLLMQPSGNPANPWSTVTGCTPDFVGDTDECDFEPAVNPGQSGGSGGPPGSVEVAVPWSAFGCTGCPTDCVCPGFGPGQDFRFNLLVARGTVSLDFVADGAIEDVMSEAVPTQYTTSDNDCAGFGIGTTACEVDDRSVDGFVPPNPPLPHELAAGGRLLGLIITKEAGGDITLDWGASCSAADNDYGIYEGDIGTYYSHDTQVACTTGGASSATFAPGGGDHYYLVVPTDGATEGSYGIDGVGAQRPVSAMACQASQSVGGCP